MTAIKTSDQSTKRITRRKVAAVLAGGLVLAVGTLATIASWNDGEFAAATTVGTVIVSPGTVTQVAGATFQVQAVSQ